MTASANQHLGGDAFPSTVKWRNESDVNQTCPFSGVVVPPGLTSVTTSLGMSLRDYFAAKALSVAWDAYDKGYCGLEDDEQPNIKLVVASAYAIADAMLKERDA